MVTIIVIALWVISGAIAAVIVHNHDSPDMPYTVKTLFAFLGAIIIAPITILSVVICTIVEGFPSEAIRDFFNKPLFRRNKEYDRQAISQVRDDPNLSHPEA